VLQNETYGSVRNVYRSRLKVDELNVSFALLCSFLFFWTLLILKKCQLFEFV
jgi:hypothetical protein